MFPTPSLMSTSDQNGDTIEGLPEAGNSSGLGSESGEPNVMNPLEITCHTSTINHRTLLYELTTRT